MTRRHSIGDGHTAATSAAMAYRRACAAVVLAVRDLEVAAAARDGSWVAVNEKAEADLVDAYDRLGRLLRSPADGGPG